MLVRFASAVAMLGCVASAPAMANFRAEFAVVRGSRDADVPGMSRLELGGDKMRMDAGNVSMLMDTGSSRMIVLIRDRHQYINVQKAVQTASTAMATANAALASLPPEQRALIERGIGDNIPGITTKVDVSVKPTGARERVGKVSCEVYRTQVNGDHREDVCLADVAAAGISGADQATLRRAVDEMKALSEQASNGMFHLPLRAVPNDKFPVRMTHYEDGRPVQVVELKSLTTGAVPGGDFAIPAGYSEASLASMHLH